MNYDAFLDRYLGQSIDWDGQYGAQCVDEVAQYCIDNGKAVAYANAKDWFQSPALEGDFDCITNDPSDPNQLPNRGDIIIWSGDLPGSGGYGHIAIWDMVTGPHTFQSLDQNWGGMYVHFIPNHTYQYVLGWLSPKTRPSAPTPVPTPEPATPETPATPFPAPVAQPDPSPVVNEPVIVPAPVVPTQTTVDPVTKTPVVHSAAPPPKQPSWLLSLIIKLLSLFVKGKK